jgi:GxxExxY protein
MNIPDRHSVNNLKHSELTGLILKSFFEVFDVLGYGFLESVYHQAMFIQLREMGLRVESQFGIDVLYKTNPIGRFYADFVVEDLVIVELKAVSDIIPAHKAQLLNYLRASDFEVGLLLNFGKRPEYKRLINDGVKHRKD